MTEEANTEAMRQAFEAWIRTMDDRPLSSEAFEAGWQAATRAAVPAWQPIETAPRDGTRVILGLADDGEEARFVGEGYWADGDDDGPDNMGHDPGFVDMHYESLVCARSFGNPKYQSKGVQPTHWMPLPAAPENKP